MNRLKISFLLAAVFIATPAHAEHSALWGKKGERWKPTGRLPDFSYAGYAGGTRTIPDPPMTASVKDFGAAGDGTTDDSAAFAEALTSLTRGVLWIPAGHYRLTTVLSVTKPEIVIRGAGQTQTILYFPKPLQDVVGPGPTKAPGGSWSWSGGFFEFQGADEGRLIAHVISNAKRGAYQLVVDHTELLQSWQWIRLVLVNTDGSLVNSLYGQHAGSPKRLLHRPSVDFADDVMGVQHHNIGFVRPLRTDVQEKWQPAIYAMSPTVHDVGLEDLTIEFPPVAYGVHHQEPGYNAVDFSGIVNGWVRRVTIRNADDCILLRDRTRFCTIDKVTLTAVSERRHDGISGHHGFLALDQSQDNLFTRFVIDERFIHDLSVSTLSAGNVFNHGRAQDLTIDHHRGAPFENLFSDIDGGLGSRMWESGGDEDDGPHSGVRETFWNIRADRPQPLPPWALEINWIGVKTTLATQKPSHGNWIEAIDPPQLQPQDLFDDQKSRRKILTLR